MEILNLQLILCSIFLAHFQNNKTYVMNIYF
jgi:hypothetical protein